MNETNNLIVSMLHQIRAELRERFDEVAARFDGVDIQLESLEKKMDELLKLKS